MKTGRAAWLLDALQSLARKTRGVAVRLARPLKLVPHSAIHIGDLVSRARDSYLLIPSVMLIGSIGLAFLMVEVDRIAGWKPSKFHPWIGSLAGSASETVLSTIAGGMATIAGVVFSIAIVALQLASSQFGPHVLRSYLRDRGYQTALGFFTGAFVYSILVTGFVRAEGLVPYAATLAALVIAVGAMTMLIYFINHMANSIRIETVLHALARQAEESARDVFPDALGTGKTVVRELVPSVPPGFDRDRRCVTLRAAGYIRRIDDLGLMRIAVERDLVLRLDCRPGDFVLSGSEVMAAAPAERADDETVRRLRQTFVLGRRRTPEQDIGYALQQLAEVAVRALSPGINAPFTTIPAIDWICLRLCEIAGRQFPALLRRDDHGKPRVLVQRPLTLAELARNSLGPIASNGSSHAPVISRLIAAAFHVARHAKGEQDRKELEALAAAFACEARAALATERERDAVEQAYATERDRRSGPEIMIP